MIRLGVVGHTGYAGLPAVLRTLRDLSPGLNLDVRFESELREEAGWGGELGDVDDLDALLTLGGDGTLLRGARLLALRPVPIFGINLGRLGFLTCAPAEQFQNALMRFARGDYIRESRMVLEARVLDTHGQERAHWLAVNDVVVHKGGFARVVTFDVTAGGEPIATYGADGVVIATPTGSTAYSLSAGGPVVYPAFESLTVTPVSAHTLAIRPVVLPPEVEVTVRPEDNPEELLVTVDGQVGTSLGAGESVSVRRAEGKVVIVRFPGTSFFATLRQKLGWGGPQGRTSGAH